MCECVLLIERLSSLVLSEVNLLVVLVKLMNLVVYIGVKLVG